MVVVGAGCVVLGGFVAAITRPLGLAEGSWLAAYLVLVCGVAQYVMGRAPGFFEVPDPPVRLAGTQFGCWNAGNLAVIAGVLLGLPILVDLGSVALAGGAVLAWLGVPSAASRSGRAGWGWAYRGMLVVLVLSLPMGIVLAYAEGRAGVR